MTFFGPSSGNSLASVQEMPALQPYRIMVGICECFCIAPCRNNERTSAGRANQLQDGLISNDTLVIAKSVLRRANILSSSEKEFSSVGM